MRSWSLVPSALGLTFVVLYLVTELFGGASGVSVLSGTDPGSPLDAVSGLVHAGAYFIAVVASPPLVLLGLLLHLGRRLGLRRDAPRASLRGDGRSKPHPDPRQQR